MHHRADRVPAALGFVVKSGWAAAVLVAGSSRSPLVLDSRRLDLSDPGIPESRQPYHAGFGAARDGGPELARLLGSVRRFGRRSVKAVIRSCTSAGHQLVGVGIVVGSLIDPERIANAHVRIHALEGRLFRRVVEDAVLVSGLACSIWRERDLQASAADVLARPEQTIRGTVASLGHGVAGPWRAEQKAATLAAWIVLATRLKRKQ